MDLYETGHNLHVYENILHYYHLLIIELKSNERLESDNLQAVLWTMTSCPINHSSFSTTPIHAFPLIAEQVLGTVRTGIPSMPGLLGLTLAPTFFLP